MRGFYWVMGDFPDLWDVDETARWLDEQSRKEVRKLFGLGDDDKDIDSGKDR